VVAQLHVGHVQAQVVEREPLGVHDGQIVAGLANHPVAYGNDLTTFFGQRHKRRGRDKAKIRALPANQRFGGHHLTGRCADLGLVVQGKLVTRLNGPPEGVGQVSAVAYPLRKIGGEKTVVVTAGVFGLVKRQVGGLEQRHAVFTILRVQGNADAGCGADLMLATYKRHMKQGMAGLHQLLYLCGALHPLNQHGELVTPDARQRVLRAHLGLQALRNLGQQQVTHRMPQGVIDQLELVQIQKDQRKLTLTALRHTQRLIQALGKQAAVGQTGECVVGGTVVLILARLLQGRLTLGHRARQRFYALAYFFQLVARGGCRQFSVVALFDLTNLKHQLRQRLRQTAPEHIAHEQQHASGQSQQNQQHLQPLPVDQGVFPGFVECHVEKHRPAQGAHLHHTQILLGRLRHVEAINISALVECGRRCCQRARKRMGQRNVHVF